MTVDLGANPHGVLGAHEAEDGVVVRTLRPEAQAVRVQPAGIEAELKDPAGLWEALLPKARLPLEYELEVEYPDGNTFTVRDPYSFLPTLGELDLHLAMEGRHEHLYERLGAHVRELDGAAGTAFAVWAPNARSVSVVGDFNSWDGRAAPDALARRVRDLGAVRPGRRRGDEVQVRDPDARRPVAAEGRPARLPHRGAAGELRRSSARRSTSGATRSGSSAGQPPTRCAGRCRSTRCISARGGATRSRATAR